MTTPKLPPPPRSAQNSSGFSSALARACVPSARTTSASIRLSIVSPCLRERWPMPPPRVRPPTPVVRDDPRRRGQAGLVGRGVDLAPRAAAADADGARGRIDLDGLQEGEVEDDSVVADPQPAAVVAAAANGEQQVVAAREGDRLGHVRGAGAAGDQRRPAVDHRVEDRARRSRSRGPRDRSARPRTSPRAPARAACATFVVVLILASFIGLRRRPGFAPDRKRTVTGPTAAVMTWIDTVRSPTSA